jgi:hypothetical protein
MLKQLYRGVRFWFNPFKSLYTKGLGGHGGHPPVILDRLLQENGFGLLLEDGNNILL